MAAAAAVGAAPAKETTEKGATFRVADERKVSDSGEVDLGLPRNLLSLYDIGDTIGKVNDSGITVFTCLLCLVARPRS